MLSQSMLYYIHLRLCEGLPQTSHLPFGGMAILLVGDPAQLPPVLANPLWTKRTTGASNTNGYALYNLFENVVKLTANQRIISGQDEFKEFLLRLRDGSNTEDDWNWITNKCSYINKSSADLERFYTMDSIAIYNSNEEIVKYNIQKLKDLNSPIVKISATVNDPSARNGNSDQCQQLDNFLYIGHNAKIVLMHNIATKYGLVNGAVGIIKDVIYMDNNVPPNLPAFIIASFNCYNGPNFFDDTDTEKLKWVILLPVTIRWTSNYADRSNRNNECIKTMFPIRLAWAWTPWKSQGSTFNCPICLHLGDIEKEHGLTYTAMSRATRVEDILLPEGLGKDRLCEKIKKLKKMNARIEEEKRLLSLHVSTLTLHERNNA